MRMCGKNTVYKCGDTYIYIYTYMFCVFGYIWAELEIGRVRNEVSYTYIESSLRWTIIGTRFAHLLLDLRFRFFRAAPPLPLLHNIRCCCCLLPVFKVNANGCSLVGLGKNCPQETHTHDRTVHVRMSVKVRGRQRDTHSQSDCFASTKVLESVYNYFAPTTKTKPYRINTNTNSFHSFIIY